MWHRPQVEAAKMEAAKMEAAKMEAVIQRGDGAPSMQRGAEPQAAGAPSASAIHQAERTIPRLSGEATVPRPQGDATPPIAGARPERPYDPRYGEARVPPPRAPSAAPAPTAAAAQAAPPGAQTTAAFTPFDAPGPAAMPGIPPKADADADWLAERLRQDALLQSQPQWSSLWKRRAVTWTLAASLLAALAAGGLWLYEENRVEGALVVVAKTTPDEVVGNAPLMPRAIEATPAAGPAPVAVMPSAPASAAPAPAAVPAAPIATDSGASAPAPAAAAPVLADTRDEGARGVDAAAVAAGGAIIAAQAPAGARRDGTAAPARRATVSDTPRRAPRREAKLASARQSNAGSARTSAAVRAPREREPSERAGAEPTARQRRELTLMQCRAHGYDERQCDLRACVMTRFGLACKG